jgi:hypothetical protein
MSAKRCSGDLAMAFMIAAASAAGTSGRRRARGAG